MNFSKLKLRAKFKWFIKGSIFFLLIGCAVFKGDKSIESIKLVYDSNSPINYGQTLNLKTIAVYANGKEREITGRKELTIQVIGGSYGNGKIKINNYPSAWMPDTLFIEAKWTTESKVISEKIKIPFNYLAELSIQFLGESGANGEDARDRNTPLLFRDGNNGENGLVGNTGFDGHQLAVYVWKVEGSELFKLKVNDLTTQLNYYFTFKDNGQGIRINVSGGNGGNGGKGGDGGTGKDAEVTEKKTKDPGDGGNGGNGGQGGAGGNGGSVMIFLHPSAIALERKFAIINTGGSGGEGGLSGAAGSPGKPLEGGVLGKSGNTGSPGDYGLRGSEGDPFQLIIEPFDIE